MLSPELNDLLSAWGINQTGSEAFRQGFCSRQLIALFAAVWYLLCWSQLADSNVLQGAIYSHFWLCGHCH